METSDHSPSDNIQAPSPIFISPISIEKNSTSIHSIVDLPKQTNPTTNPLSELDEGAVVDRLPHRSSIPVELRRSPVAMPLYNLKDSSSKAGTKSGYGLPIHGIYHPRGLLEVDYDKNLYVPDGITDPIRVKNKDGNWEWGGDVGEMKRQIPNVLYLRSNPFFKVPEGPVEEWELDDNSRLAYAKAMEDYKRSTNSTQPFFYPNTLNTQASLSFDILQDQLSKWQSLSPTSNSKGFTCYSTGVAIINLSSGVGSVVSYVSEEGTALSEAVKIIHGAAVAILYPFILLTKSGKERELLEKEWELRNSATLGNMWNKYFSSMQINISIPGQDITISLGSFGHIHIDAGDHHAVGTTVIDVSICNSKNAYSGGGAHIPSGTYATSSGFSLYSFLGTDLHLPLNTKNDPTQPVDPNDRRMTLVAYGNNHAISRVDDNGVRKMMAVTDANFIGNDTARTYKTFLKNSNTFFCVPLRQPGASPRLRPIPPPISPTDEAVRLDPNLILQYDSAIENWKQESFNYCEEVKQAVFIAREQLLLSATATTTEFDYLETRPNQEPLMFSSTLTMRQQWSFLRAQDPFEASKFLRPLPTPSVFPDEEEAAIVFKELRQYKELSLSMTTKSSRTTRGISLEKQTSLPTSDVDGRPTYYSECLISHSAIETPREDETYYRSLAAMQEEEVEEEEMAGAVENLYELPDIPEESMEVEDEREAEAVPIGRAAVRGTNGGGDGEEEEEGEEAELLSDGEDPGQNLKLQTRSASSSIKRRAERTRKVKPVDRMTAAKAKLSSFSNTSTSTSTAAIELKPFDLSSFIDEHAITVQNVSESIATLKINPDSPTFLPSTQLSDTQTSFGRRGKIISNFNGIDSSSITSSPLKLFDYISLSLLIQKKTDALLSNTVLQTVTTLLDNRAIGIGYIDLSHLLNQVIPTLSDLVYSDIIQQSSSAIPAPFIGLGNLVLDQCRSKSKDSISISAESYQGLISTLPTLSDIIIAEEDSKTKKKKKQEQKKRKLSPPSPQFPTPPEENLRIPSTTRPSTLDRKQHFIREYNNVLINLFILPTFLSLDRLGVVQTQGRQGKKKADVGIEILRRRSLEILEQRCSLATLFSTVVPSYYAFSIPQVIKIIQAPQSFLLHSTRGTAIPRSIFNKVESNIKEQINESAVRSKLLATKELFDCALLALTPIRSLKSRQLSSGPDFSRTPPWYQKDNYIPGELWIIYLTECIAVMIDYPPINIALNNYIRSDLDKRMAFRLEAPSLAGLFEAIPPSKSFTTTAIYSIYIRRFVTFGQTTSSSIKSPLSTPTNSFKSFNDTSPSIFSPKSFKDSVMIAKEKKQVVANSRAYSSPTQVHVSNAAVAAVTLPKVLAKVEEKFGVIFNGDRLEENVKRITYSEGLSVIKTSLLPLTGGKLLAPLLTSDLATFKSFVLPSTEFERGNTLELGGQKGVLYLNHSKITGSTAQEITEEAQLEFIKIFQFLALHLPLNIQQILNFNPDCLENASCKVVRAINADVMVDLKRLSPETSLIHPEVLRSYSTFQPDYQNAIFNSHTSTSNLPEEVPLPPSPNSLLLALLEFDKKRKESGFEQGYKFKKELFDEATSCESWSETSTMQLGDERFEAYFRGALTEGAETDFRPSFKKDAKPKGRVQVSRSRVSQGKITSSSVSKSSSRSKGKRKRKEESSDDEEEEDLAESNKFRTRSQVKKIDINSASNLLKNSDKTYGKRSEDDDDDDDNDSSSSDKDRDEDEDKVDDEEDGEVDELEGDDETEDLIL